MSQTVVPFNNQKGDGENSIYEALVNVQSEVMQPRLDKTSGVKGAFSYKYASLGEVQKVLKDPLMKHGLCILQYVVIEDEKYYLITSLRHKSGNKWDFKTPMHGNFNNDPKNFGSAMTYSRRYSLYGIFNLYGQEDTDAQEIKDDGKISANQLEELKKFTSTLPIEKLDAFLDFFGISKIHDLKSTYFDQAMKKLRATVKTMESFRD